MKSALIIFGLLVLLALALRFGLGEQDRGWSTTQPAVLLSHDEAAGPIDDERWLLADATVVDGYEGSFWLRTFVEFRESSFRHIRIDGTASFDVWWDGEFLGRNGRLDADGSEVETGRMDSLFSLPESLAGQGWHSLVLRANRDALPGRPLSGGVSFLKGSDYPFNLMSQVVMAILTAVIALGSGGVYLILSFRHPSRVQAIYIAFCAAFFFLALAEAWRHVFGYTYPWQPIRLQVIAGLTALTGVLLNAVLFVYFSYRRLIWLAAAMMLVLGVSYTLLMRQPDTFGVLAAAFCVGLATVTCSIATYQARPGAPLLLSCLAGGLALNLLNISYVDEWGVFAVFLLFATAVNFSLARDMRQIAQSFAEAQLRSLRLRQELYRRFIQPHFMLNTLTTISEWIAIAPDQAEEAVGELAGEVRVLGRMIDRDLVPVSEEINLCELHCKVMSRRLRTEFRLEMHGEFGGTLPPAVLHTLVENVFAHNRYSAPHVVLRLECTQSAGRRILRLIAPRGDAAHSPTGDGPGGLQYVRARLAEAYAENWQLEVCDEAGFWIAELHTPAEAI